MVHQVVGSLTSAVITTGAAPTEIRALSRNGHGHEAMIRPGPSGRTIEYCGNITYPERELTLDEIKRIMKASDLRKIRQRKWEASQGQRFAR